MNEQEIEKEYFSVLLNGDEKETNVNMVGSGGVCL